MCNNEFIKGMNESRLHRFFQPLDERTRETCYLDLLAWTLLQNLLATSQHWMSLMD